MAQPVPRQRGQGSFPIPFNEGWKEPRPAVQREPAMGILGRADAAGVPPATICNCDFAWVPQNLRVEFAALGGAGVVGRSPSAQGSEGGLTSSLELAPDGKPGLPPSLAMSGPRVRSGRGHYGIGPSLLHA